ncbi:hypothetical protein [Streptomyces sp. MB09-02B]|uniref:hypothetical protein n=1 Tax=Streptomyces sp. MB09-02B TaxID=3028667 RepID=UPI0029A215F4|nr:hypothetical protein [Streptomyces sp. MB09-02B]MDX3641722.1 hypothetical protein [Streptomyces sp. MB09-02B]
MPRNVFLPPLGDTAEAVSACRQPRGPHPAVGSDIGRLHLWDIATQQPWAAR